MQRKRMNAAEFALLERKLAASKPKRDKAKPKTTVGKIPSAVSGGFKAGKRKRGNSLLRKDAKTQVRVIPLTIRDSNGMIVADNVKTVNYSRKVGK